MNESIKSEAVKLLRHSRIWIYINAITAIVFAIFTVYRATRDKHFFDYSELVTIFFSVTIIFISRYIVQLYKLAALNKYLKTGEMIWLEKYYGRSFAFWLMEGIIYIIIFLLIMMAFSSDW